MQNDIYKNPSGHYSNNVPTLNSHQGEEEASFDYDEEHRTQEMLRYVEPPIERNGLNDTDYKSTLSTHYRQANKFWDTFKSPAHSALPSPEEAEQQKRADELYDNLHNDASTDYSQRPFEEQQAKEIAKITYKTDFQRIMNETDSRRMNIINKMVRDRTKLKFSAPATPQDSSNVQAPNSEHKLPPTVTQRDSTKSDKFATTELEQAPPSSSLQLKQNESTNSDQQEIQSSSAAVGTPINNNAQTANNSLPSKNILPPNKDSKEDEEHKLNDISTNQHNEQDKKNDTSNGRSPIKSSQSNKQEELEEPDAEGGFLNWLEESTSNLTTSAINTARNAANVLLIKQVPLSGYVSRFNNAMTDALGTLGILGTLSLLDSAEKINPLSNNAANVLRSAAGYIAEASKEGHDTIDYADLIQREALNATIIANNAGVSQGLKYLKNKIAGDIPRYSQETTEWLKIVQPTIKGASPVFGNNKILTLSTAMAAGEELNRRGYLANKIIDSTQDQIVALTGEVPSRGIISPNIGAANINMETAQNLKSRLQELPNQNHPDMIEMKQKVLGEEKELSQYLLTAKGTFMLGNSIMHLIMQDVEQHNLFPDDMPEKDVIQNLVDIWREGPDRIERMLENKAEAEREGKTYYPEHKHQHNNITEENLQDLMRIIYPEMTK